MHLGTKSLRVAHKPRPCQPDRRAAGRVLVRRRLGLQVSGLPAGGGREVCTRQRNARLAVRRLAAARYAFRAGSIRTRFYVTRTTNPCPKTTYIPSKPTRHHPFTSLPSSERAESRAAKLAGIVYQPSVDTALHAACCVVHLYLHTSPGGRSKRSNLLRCCLISAPAYPRVHRKFRRNRT